MADADYVLAVDGGGTKTDAELLSRGGQVLGRGRAGPCNLHQDSGAGLAAVLDAWSQCCAGAGLDPADMAGRTAVSAALAGVSAPVGRDGFYAAARPFARALLSSDAYAALLGAFEGGPGVLLSVGTGTVACSLDARGRYARRGGWGFPAGDRGGGAWLGLQLVTAWLERRDGMGAAAAGDEALWAEAARRVGDDRAAILSWLRRASPGAFAALAPAVLDAAGRGSPFAAALLDEAAEHLARLVRALRPDPDMEVALGGGLASTLAPRIAALLGRDLPARPAAPLRGAWLIGCGQAPPEFTPNGPRGTGGGW